MGLGKPQNGRSFRILLFCAAFAFFPRALFSGNSSGGEYQLDNYSLGTGGGALQSGGEYTSKSAVGQPILPPASAVRQGGGYADRAGFYSPAHFACQRGLPCVLAFPGGTATLTLPPGAVDKDTFDIYLNKDMLAPLISDPAEIAQANAGAFNNYGAWALSLADNITETYIFDEEKPWSEPFLKQGTLSLAYADANGDGIIDGTNPPLRADNADIWTLDRDKDMWVKVPTSLAGNMLTIPFGAPSVFAVLGTVDQSVKDVYAFPVPFRPNGPRAGVGAGRTGTAADGITFTNLPQGGKIEIFTADGLLARSLAIPENLVLPQVKWDVKNSAGEKARSDVYIWRVTSGSNAKTGKLMIIW